MYLSLWFPGDRLWNWHSYNLSFTNSRLYKVIAIINLMFQSRISWEVWKVSKFHSTAKQLVIAHCRALEGSDPHELAGGFEVCQMKGTHIGTSELKLFKSYKIVLLRIRPLCFLIKMWSPKFDKAIKKIH